jgi:hypothetical protein
MKGSKQESNESCKRSAQRTNENSPPIHRWGSGSDMKMKSVKRTAEVEGINDNSVARFTGSRIGLVRLPSTEMPGYFRVAR